MDERITSENHPSAGNPEALAREYGGKTPGVSHPGTPVQGLAFPEALADTSALSPEAARAEHGRLMRDPGFQQRLANGYGKKGAMDHLERLSERMFGNPAAAPGRAEATSKAVTEATAELQAARKEDLAAKYANATSEAERSRILAEMQRPVTLSAEEQRAVTALADYQAELADPAELAAFDAACEPKSANEFTAIGSPAAKGILMQHGISPVAANFIAQQHGEFSRWDEPTYDAKVDAAAALILKRPDGRTILKDAQRYLDSLSDRHPMARAAEVAATFAPGIVELARLGRRERTVAN